jgi:outer membrane protein assembly factor BamD
LINPKHPSIKVNIRPIVILLLFLTMASACSNKRHIRTGDTLEVAFEKANAFYERGRYTDAARSFETVLSIGRGTEIAQDSQFLLAMSYYNNREFLISASEFRRYATNFPRSERRVEAEFKEALSYYRLSPRYKLDQSDTYRAIELMQLFIVRYPGSEEARQAAGHIDEMRNKLAQKEFGAAELYMRVRQFQAAAVYYGLTLDRFPETIWAERALARQIRAYILFAENSVEERQAERFRQALNSYETYVQLFPRGENRSIAEELADRAREGMATAISRDLARLETAMN